MIDSPDFSKLTKTPAFQEEVLRLLRPKNETPPVDPYYLAEKPPVLTGQILTDFVSSSSNDVMQSGVTSVPGPLGGYNLPASPWNVSIGFPSPNAGREMTIINDEAPVDMNDSAIVFIPKGATGRVFTDGIGGCTGVAAIAAVDGGILAGVAHFDPITDAFHRPNSSASPTVEFMRRFIGLANGRGALQSQVSVFFDLANQEAPEKGSRQGSFNSWYFLDQIETMTSQPFDHCVIDVATYGHGGHHGLAAGIIDGFTGITFDENTIPYNPSAL